MSRRVPHVFLDRFRWVGAPHGSGLVRCPTRPARFASRPTSPRGGEVNFLCLAAGGGHRTPGLGWEWMGSDLFRHPETRRAGAGVGLQLRLGWTDGTAGDDAEGCPVAAGADWLLGWADTVFGLDVEE